MNCLVNLELKYKELYDEFILYCHKNHVKFPEVWDKTSATLWDNVQEFEIFCNRFFNINIKDTYPSA